MKVHEVVDALRKMDPHLEVVAPTWDHFMHPIRIQEWNDKEVAIFPVAPVKEVDPKAVIPSVCFDDGEIRNLEPDTWIHFGELTFIFHRNGNVEIDPSFLRFDEIGKGTDEVSLERTLIRIEKKLGRLCSGCRST